MAHTEREVKFTLSRRDYERVTRTCRLRECRDQLNVYYHDPARLGEESGYLRVRFEPGAEAVVTVKIPRRWEGAVREMVEVEEPLSRLGPALFPLPRRRIGVSEDLSEEMAAHFHELGITHLSRLGWMRNHRCLLDLGDLGLADLDRTSLPGGEVHYEIEVEGGSQELLAEVLARVREVAPSAAPSRVGKFTRFLEATSRGRPTSPDS